MQVLPGDLAREYFFVFCWLSPKMPSRILQRLLLRTIREQKIQNLCKFPPICCQVSDFLKKLCIFLRKNRQCVLGSFSSPFFFFILHRVRVLQVIYFQTTFLLSCLRNCSWQVEFWYEFWEHNYKKATSSENRQPVPKARVIRKGPRTYYCQILYYHHRAKELTFLCALSTYFYILDL